MLLVGEMAPDITLPDADMEMVSLSNYRDKKNVVLYFYPKDDTPGCTVQALEFSALKDKFADCDTVIFGISRDDCLSHGSFRDKHDITVCLLDRPRHNQVINELKELKVKLKLISDGDVAGALLVTDDKYNVDVFLGIGGGPEGVLAASALDAFGCKFQGRFLFKSDKDIARAKKMGIKDLNKKYELNEIVKGDSIFCASGITTNNLVNGIKLNNGKYNTETLVTHKNSAINIVKKEVPIT